MVEAPLELQKGLTIPEDHYQACRDGDMPYAGNAAANTEDFLDLGRANVSPPYLPDGYVRKTAHKTLNQSNNKRRLTFNCRFTARGIVALVFSIVSAFLGMAVVGWYGSRPITGSLVASAKKKVQAAGLS